MPSSTVLMKLVSAGDERLEADRQALLLGLIGHRAEQLDRPLPGALGRLVLQDIALLGRAEDQDLAAQIAAQVQQGGQVIARPLPDRLVRRGHVQGQRSLGEQPVQADDFEAVVLDDLAGFPPLLGGDFRRRGGEREGGEFEAMIAEPAATEQTSAIGRDSNISLHKANFIFFPVGAGPRACPPNNAETIVGMKEGGHRGPPLQSLHFPAPRTARGSCASGTCWPCRCTRRHSVPSRGPSSASDPS